MKKFLTAAALTAVLFVPGVASADAASDRAAAIRTCRAEVASQTGVAIDDVRLDQARVRGTTVRVDLDVWRNGQLQNVRCDATRAEEPTIVAISPTLQTASAQ
ncbi:hypothetical protein [Vitreimonas sp.]|jgi:hypothetical protein|uniref:hypothetical protein n=1 Tax=Vitreimonas sp. TaxID=3069702 RepID=UPI002EDB9248